MDRWSTAERLRHVAAGSVALVFASVFAFVSVAVAASLPTLQFSFHSQPEAKRDLDWMRSQLPAQRVRVLEPYEEGKVEFEAIPFAGLLDAVYGQRWRAEEELLFTCSDGYQPTVSVKRVLQHQAWLAFARADSAAFEILKQESGRPQQISLAPFYLVWSNLDDAQMRDDGDYGWPYQVIGVDLIRTADRLPNIVPAAGAPAPVQAGFEAFRMYCSRCHAMGGDGGTIGPDLNGIARPIDSRDRDWLRRWIDDPSLILPTTRMPPLSKTLPQRALTIDNILAYLESMSKAHPAATVPLPSTNPQPSAVPPTAVPPTGASPGN